MASLGYILHFQTSIGELRAALSARPQIVLANVDTIADHKIQVEKLTDPRLFYKHLRHKFIN